MREREREREREYKSMCMCTRDFVCECIYVGCTVGITGDQGRLAGTSFTSVGDFVCV